MNIRQAGILLFLLLALGAILFQPIKIFAQNLIDFRLTTKNETVQEASSPSESTSANWWLDSGGTMTITDGVAKTFQGDVNPSNYWYQLYKKNNPTDTDSGLHPQNIFRLITKSSWQNSTQSNFFKIRKINQSASPNRNESNAILLFNRYLNDDNLYYAGLRVDGYVVVKKKIDGKYYTLGSKRILSGEYNKSSKPNLIPVNSWHGIKTEIKNEGDSVIINLFTDMYSTGVWTRQLSVKDSGTTYGRKPIIETGAAGVRTDFMDVEMRNYKILPL